MNKHITRFVSGMKFVATVVLVILLGAGAAFVLLSPIVLADTYSMGWLWLYVPMIAGMAYWVGDV